MSIDLGAVYVAMGQRAQAEPLYLRSLAILEDAPVKDNLRVAIFLNQIGLLYADMGQHAKAEPFYLRSVSAFEAMSGREGDVAIVLYNLSISLHGRGQYARKGRASLLA